MRPTLLSWAAAVCLAGLPAFASQLTVCGVLDGGVGDSNPLLGTISTNCQFGSTGSFSGTVTESADPLNYQVVIRGTFQGSGTDSAFVTGSFSLTGLGDLYPYIRLGGQMQGPVGVLAGSSDFFELSAQATNIFGSAASSVNPVQPGWALPQPLTSSGGNLASGVFSGPGTLTAGISFAAHPDAAFVFNSSGPIVLASTDPNHPIPEPSTWSLLGAAALAALLRPRRRSADG